MPASMSSDGPTIGWRVLRFGPSFWGGLTTPSADTVSGIIGFQLIVKVPPKTALTSNSVILRIQEETDSINDVAHPFEENHIDFPFTFGNRGWSVWHSVGNQAPVLQTNNSGYVYGSANDFNKSDSVDVYYTAALSWDSTKSSLYWGFPPEHGVLLGHNGAHTMSIVEVDGEAGNSVYFAGLGGQIVCHPEQTEYQVKNLTITDVSTNQVEGKSDYIKFDPASSDNVLAKPTISFKIDDLDEGLHYSWNLKVWDTRNVWQDGNTVLWFQGKTSSPGLVTVALNDPDAVSQTQNGVLGDYGWGTYASNIYVEEIVPEEHWNDIEDTFDPQEYRTGYNGYIPEWIGEDMKPTYSGNPHRQAGYTMDIQQNDEGEEQASIRYFLNDDPAYYSEDPDVVGLDFSALKVELMPYSLGAAVTTYNAPSDKRKINVFNPLLDQPATVIHTFSDADTDGPYTAIFTGADGHAEEYRDHLAKRIIPRSVTANSSYISLFFWDYLTDEIKAEVDKGPDVPADYDPKLDSSLTGEESTEKPPYCAGVDASTVSSNTVTVKWWYSEENESEAHSTELSSVTPTESISDGEWQTKWGMSLEQKQAYDERGSVATVLKHKFNATSQWNYLFLKVTVSPDGVLDNVGNVYDANPETEAIETSAKYQLKVAENGTLTIVGVTYQ